ncbi:hypothetical protein ACSU6B_23110 [Neobacillus sp. C211]|uniref:hypothetical protein n=1 Tax=unclassified Neobacillus TaxID=2675272 RepID=UPI0039783060
MNFKKWIETFVEEKGFQNEAFTFELQEQFHMVEMDFLVEFLKELDSVNQKKIKDMLVKIDFMNGNCLDFLKHCAKGYVHATYCD